MSRIREKAGGIARRTSCLFAPRCPVYVFHHIPKCGGTSLKRVLGEAFILVEDYREGRAREYREKVDIGRLRSCHCLCGHFAQRGNYLHERYPEVFMSERYRVFTFVRDPLALRLSLFRYARKRGRLKVDSLEEHLSLPPNYLARRLPATADNYKDVIDRYFFVGVLEEAETSLALLSCMIGKPLAGLPWLNRTLDDAGGNDDLGGLREESIESFREANALDYEIYDYCVERLRSIANSQTV